MASEDEKGSGKKVFVGAKGEFFFGAVKAPGSDVKAGRMVSKEALYAFYDGIANKGGKTEAVTKSGSQEKSEPKATGTNQEVKTQKDRTVDQPLADVPEESKPAPR